MADEKPVTELTLRDIQKIGSLPKHVGIIMDGNRRLAKRVMAKPWKGHEWGKDRVEEVLTWCQDFDIKELTLFAFSAQNFDRPKTEFDYLIKLFNEGLDQLLYDEDTRKKIKNVKIRFIGRIHKFPDSVKSKMHQIMEETADRRGHILNFAMAYGGREEITDAVKDLADDVKSGKLDPDQIDESVIASHLYINSEPDLIIRTGGERRTSNFLIWQANYAEWMFIGKMWPEFERQDFAECLKEFVSRERRFGK